MGGNLFDLLGRLTDSPRRLLCLRLHAQIRQSRLLLLLLLLLGLACLMPVAGLVVRVALSLLLVWLLNMASGA